MARVICGDNSATSGMTSAGICKGAKAGYIYNLTGQSGQMGSYSSGDGYFAASAKYAQLMGITYDGFKNIVVSSGSYDRYGSAPKLDSNIRRIKSEVVSPKVSVKFTFTDSNSLSSDYCMRAKDLTSCDSDGTCKCRLAAPTDENIPEAWVAVSSSKACDADPL